MFEIKYQVKGALFHVVLPRLVEQDEAHQLAQLAINLTKQEEVVYGSAAPANLAYIINQENHINSQVNNGVISQTKLAEHKTTKINMFNYVEPKDGVRIKMLAFPTHNKVPAIKAFRDHTGISVVGSKEIVYGNYPCPILSEEVATKILEEFRMLDIYAKIIPANQLAMA